VLDPGDTLDIPAGVAHQMWNAGPEPVTARWETRPAGRTAEWFRALDAKQRAGKTGRNGMPPLPAMAALLTEYDDVFRLAVKAPGVVQGALKVIARVNRDQI
jgi:hypothetical protein